MNIHGPTADLTVYDDNGDAVEVEDAKTVAPYLDSIVLDRRLQRHRAPMQELDTRLQSWSRHLMITATLNLSAVLELPYWR
jgi:hypothetical protein